jgi:hypothetical protein
MAQLAINASPFQCQWIATGTEMRLEQWTYAICQRCRNGPRVVSEDECGRCASWEPPTDGGCAHDNHGARQSAFLVVDAINRRALNTKKGGGDDDSGRF